MKRSILRFLGFSLCVLVGLFFLGNGGGSFSYPRDSPLSTIEAVEEVESVGMTVSDMDRAIDFYSQVLSFEKISDVEVYGSAYESLQGLFGLRMRVVKMRLGDEILELTDYLTTGGRPIPIDARSNDRFFQHIAIVVSDLDRAYRILRENKVQYVSTAPQRLPEYLKNAAGIEAFYFRDPDGHNLEIIHFPNGKGAPKWQNSTGGIFLGIDHTAIVVSDTETSLHLYRNLLGLKLAGESENYGIEQEHLNNVAGARLRISGLRASRGPGIEFLEYLNPRDGKPFPADSRPDDLLHWQTTLVVEEVGATAEYLRSRGYKSISWDKVELPERTLGFTKALLFKDPDGHTLRIVEK